MSRSMKNSTFLKALLKALLVSFLFSAGLVYAVPVVVVAAVFAIESVVVATVVTFAINIALSAIVSSILAPKPPSSGGAGGGGAQPNPGVRQQLVPAGDNRLGVVYGRAVVASTAIDLSITSDNQDIYYVMAIAECTGDEIGSPDTYTFGNIWWAGKRCEFDPNDATKVVALIDESNNARDTSINGYLNFYLYRRGSFDPANTTQTAVQILSGGNLIYTWDASKKMNNAAFAIIHLKYSQSAGTTGLQQARFELTNSRYAPGDCLLDYFRSSRYGCGLGAAEIDTASLTALNTYCAQPLTYTSYSGVTTTLPNRFRFDGLLDTSPTCVANLQAMADSCDCLIKFNEINATWGVVVQQPNITTVMDLSDSNLVSSIQISSTDTASTFNILEVQFPDGSNKDSFNAATFDLKTVAPTLLYPNEPINKLSLKLLFVNNDVRAQLIANRALKSARQSTAVQCEINYAGIQLEAGDWVTLTNANYGFNLAKFRVLKITEKFGSDGSITASVSLQSADPAVWNDVAITQYTPPVTSGLADALSFGQLFAPVISNAFPALTTPQFTVNITASASGVVAYASIYYSALQNPTQAQLNALGTTAISPAGQAYPNSLPLPATVITNLPAGDWYIFYTLQNSLGGSAISPASTLLQWRPLATQFVTRYLAVVYADTPTSGFSLTPANKSYFGLRNQATTTVSNIYSDYIWFLASPLFSTNNYFLYANLGNRKFSYNVGTADFAAGSGNFVPSNTAQYDPSIWGALVFTSNIVDLDLRTGQVTTSLTTVSGIASGELATTNVAGGTAIASLSSILNLGGSTSTYLPGPNVTVDRYGRIIGFGSADAAYQSTSYQTATAGQTVFNVSRTAGYLNGDCWVFVNGAFRDSASYTDAFSGITFGSGLNAGDWVAIVSFRNQSTSAFYEDLGVTVASVSGNTLTFSNRVWQNVQPGNVITFANSGTPAQFTVSSFTSTTITFTSAPTATVGSGVYRFLAASVFYPSFSRFNQTITNVSTFSPTSYMVHSGFEFLFLAGRIVIAANYNITSGNINFTGNQSGALAVINMAANNLAQPVFGALTQTQGTSIGVALYTVPTYVANSLLIFYNGLLLRQGTDYTTTSSSSITLTTTPTVATDMITATIFTSSGSA